MRSKAIHLTILLATILIGCSKSIEYSETFKKQTSGKYLYNPDEIILVYYEGNKLHLNWKGGEIEPVALEENEFFVPDMYKKFRFVQHPQTNERYLSVISEDNEENVSYDYLKINDNYKTPSSHLKSGNYKAALKGYLEIKKQDSTSSYIEERNFNSLGYSYLRDNKYEDAIEVFKINTILHPYSSNVFDSLADAYLRNGDSLQAYSNYVKALNMDPRNERAQRYLKVYKPEKDKL
ncbi:MAG: tetratricopeptide repeat protein [Winogradskyella sp.]|uniref:tetratricopeptide repeat protein n=1 Tax=Winogradskyella sp. TaxID=1883156 RepID=UPI001846F305|nr:tetratricopeptide repeat protein [Winogradskyella sp.]